MLRGLALSVGCAAWIAFSAGVAGAEVKSAQTLASEATTLYQAAAGTSEPHERGHLMFLVMQRIEEIRSAYPKSVIAAQLAFGNYQGIDIAMVEREAKAWSEAYPTEALALQEAAPAGGGASGTSLVPNFGASSAKAPSALVPSFGAGGGGQATSGSGATNVAVIAPDAAGKVLPGTPKRLAQTELVQRLRKAVVFAYDPVGGTGGTAFFISPQYLMTNAHVVEGVNRMIIASREIGVRSAHVLYKGSSDRGIDAAVLQVDGWTNPSVLPFADPDDLEEGAAITIAGYPGRAATFDKPWEDFFASLADNSLPTADSIPNVKYDFGFVQSIFINKDTGLHNVQEGVNTSHGNSGSPIINRCGAVVALHYTGSGGSLDVTKTDSGEIKAEGDMSKFNYGISTAEIVNFLKARGTPFTSVSGKCPAAAD
jgi:V8-like Glu-specific endopeptidase